MEIKGDWFYLRIGIISDLHYNYEVWSNPNKTLLGLTGYERIELAVECLNNENPDLVIVNGDIFELPFSQPVWGNVKNILDGLNPPYYVSKGNHDAISKETWDGIFNMDVIRGEDDIYHFEFQNYAFVCLDVFQTPNGGSWKEVVIDETELGNILNSYANKEGIFVFSHWITTISTRQLISNTENVKALFFGHSHLKAFTISGYNMPIYTDQHFSAPYDGTQRHYDRNKPWGFRVVDVDDNGDLSTYMVEVFHFPPRPAVVRRDVVRRDVVRN